MKKIIVPLCSAMLAIGMAAAGAKGVRDGEQQRNYAATRGYYAQLISGNTPRLAELNLLMTMMPKGGDLHHHYSGALYAETYLEWVGRQGFCVYREDDAAHHKMKYQIESSQPATASASNTHCLKVDAIREDNQFYRELLMHWSSKDFSNHFQQQSPPDQHFFETFGLFGPVSGFSPNEGFNILKQRAKAENLQYIETILARPPGADNPALAAQIDALPADAGDDAVNRALAAFADFMAHDDASNRRIAAFVKGIADDAAGIDDADFTLRFQLYVLRGFQPSRVFSDMVAAFASAQMGGPIVGVNIVGPENGYVALRDYKLHMRMFRFLKQRFPAVHLSLHAGELALGMVPPEELRSHIRDAVTIAGAERIGHGVDVTYEDNPDQLLDLLKAKDIPVEVNLSSNAFILGVQQEAHPVAVYLRHHVPFVIATDDAGVSRNNLGGEYLLFVSRYKPSYDTLKQTVYNSIRYSFLNPQEKAAQIRALDRRFARFEAAVEKLARPAAGKSERNK